MKKRTFLAMSMAAALTVGCSSDDITSDNGGGVNKDGQAYVGLSITLPSTTGQRSKNDVFHQGTESEYNVNTLTVRYLDNSGTELWSREYGASDLIWSTPPTTANGITTKAVLPVEKVPFNDVAYALVEINNPFGGSIAANNVVECSASTIATAKSFFMTNTVRKDGKYLVEVHAKQTETEAQALASTHTIYVERAAAKVQMTCAGDNKTFTIAENKANDGATITINSWKLDVTNTKMYPIRKFAGSQTYDPTPYSRFYSTSNADFRTYWAEDPNYSSYAEDFAVVKDADAIKNNVGDVEYCLENTFDVANQCQNQTTRVLIKATYTPKNITLNNDNKNWYTLGNSATPLDKTALEGKIKEALGLKDGTVEFNQDLVAAGEQTFIKNMVKVDNERANDEQIAKINKSLGKLVTYKGGECFYVVRIKHFGDEICPWGNDTNAPLFDAQGNKVETETKGTTRYVTYADKSTAGFTPTDDMKKYYLGRYGVVRNNWYKVNITGVSQPGTPTIPALTQIQDDEHYNYIQSTINILDWAVRDQGVEL